MKPHHVLLITALSPLLILAARAQDHRPPLLPQPPMPHHRWAFAATYSSRISAVVYGPQGEVQALALRNGVAVSLPPDLGAQLQTTVVKGARVQVSGTQRVIAGQTSLLALSLTANGQTIVAIQPPPPIAEPLLRQRRRVRLRVPGDPLPSVALANPRRRQMVQHPPPLFRLLHRCRKMP